MHCGLHLSNIVILITLLTVTDPNQWFVLPLNRNEFEHVLHFIQIWSSGRFLKYRSARSHINIIFSKVPFHTIYRTQNKYSHIKPSRLWQSFIWYVSKMYHMWAYWLCWNRICSSFELAWCTRISSSRWPSQPSTWSGPSKLISRLRRRPNGSTKQLLSYCNGSY